MCGFLAGVGGASGQELRTAGRRSCAHSGGLTGRDRGGACAPGGALLLSAADLGVSGRWGGGVKCSPTVGGPEPARARPQLAECCCSPARPMTTEERSCRGAGVRGGQVSNGGHLSVGSRCHGGIGVRGGQVCPGRGQAASSRSRSRPHREWLGCVWEWDPEGVGGRSPLRKPGDRMALVGTTCHWTERPRGAGCHLGNGSVLHSCTPVAPRAEARGWAWSHSDLPRQCPCPQDDLECSRCVWTQLRGAAEAGGRTTFTWE